MIHRKNIGTPLLLIALLSSASIVSDSAHASIMESHPNEIKKIAQKFLKKIAPKMNTIHITIPLISDENGTTNSESPLWGLVDGEELILQITTDKFLLSEFAIAIKQGDSFYLSLTDFIDALDFPIEIDTDSGTAQGWFINEQNNFIFNLNEKSISIKNQKSAILDSDFIKRDDGIFIKSTALEAWFDLSFNLVVKDMTVAVDSEQTLPVIEQENRKKRAAKIFKYSNGPKYRIIDEEPSWLSAPNVDIQLNQAFHKLKDSNAELSSRYSVITANEFLLGRLNAFFTGTDKQSVEELRIDYIKEADKGKDLGVMGIKSLQIGDIPTTPVVFGAGHGRESGIRLSTFRNDVRNNNQTTIFEGAAQPGWDVELYRNNILIKYVRVTDNGQYRFEDIELYSGENDFKLVFYGPQGQIREELESIPVYGATTDSGESAWDVSITRQNEITYRNNQTDNPDTGFLSFSGRYERGLTDWLSLNSGLSIRSNNDDAEITTATGAKFSLGRTLLDINAALENDGGIGGEILARHDFGFANVRARTQINSNDFNTSDNNNDNVTKQANINVSGKLFQDKAISYGLNTQYSENNSGLKRWSTEGSLATNLYGWHLGSGLSYNNASDFGLNNTINGRFNISGSLLGNLYVHGLTNYTISPDPSIKSYSASLNHPISNLLTSQYELEHFVTSGITEGTAALNIKHKNYTITPRISLDSDKNLTAYMNLHFGLGRDPYSGKFAISGSNMTNSGGVSSLVYHDLNANYIYDDGDIPLQDINIEAVKRNKSDYTNENGIAYIPDLRKGLITDIEINENNLPDPTWMPLIPGLAVDPRIGHVSYIEFPVVMTGEIDGRVNATNKFGSLYNTRNFAINLYNSSGEIVQTTETAYDGYYSMIKIIPGDYFLGASPKKAGHRKLQRPPLRKIHIGADGTIYSNLNFTLVSENIIPERIPKTIKYINDPENKTYGSILPGMVAKRESVIALNLGKYKSDTMRTVRWLRLNKEYPELFSNVRKLSLRDQEQRKDYPLIIGPILSFEQANDICNSIPKELLSDCTTIVQNDS